MKQTNADAVEKLGNGILYDGELESDFKLRIVNEVQDGSVVSRGVLSKVKDGKTIERDIGNLFGYDMQQIQGKFVAGQLNADGLIDIGVPNTETLIKKDVQDANNYVNIVRVKTSTWEANHKIVSDVGHLEWDEETGAYQGLFTEENSPEFLTLAPIKRIDDTSVREYVSGYVVNVDPTGIGQYEVNANDPQYMHFMANGTRYRASVKNLKIDRFEFNEMDATTVDFTSTYNVDKLRENLWMNFKTFMLNLLVHHCLSYPNSPENYESETGAM